ncbi:MAG: hypothetical protein ACYC3X_07800 [Pirellulaceae bacterium]
MTGGEEKFEQLSNEYFEKYKWFVYDYSKAENDQQRQEIIDARYPGIEFFPRFCALADEYAESPVAFQCLACVCQVAGQPYVPQQCSATIQRVAETML